MEEKDQYCLGAPWRCTCGKQGLYSQEESLGGVSSMGEEDFHSYNECAHYVRAYWPSHALLAIAAFFWWLADRFPRRKTPKTTKWTRSK